MAITQRTVEEASKYIQDSIESWKSAGQDKKIISLSILAEKWSSNAGGHITKMRELLKDINALKGIIKRKKKRNIKTESYENDLQKHLNAYNDLVEKYGELKPKNKEGQINLPKAE